MDSDDSIKLYVGNIHYSLSEGDLITLVSPHGSIDKVWENAVMNACAIWTQWLINRSHNWILSFLSY